MDLQRTIFLLSLKSLVCKESLRTFALMCSFRRVGTAIRLRKESTGLLLKVMEGEGIFSSLCRSYMRPL